MAKNQEIMEINLRKNTNASSKGYGKYYGFVEFNGTLTTRALAEHIASHGSLWTRDLVEGVQNQLKVCLPLLKIAKAELEDTIINRKRFASLVGSLFICIFAAIIQLLTINTMSKTEKLTETKTKTRKQFLSLWVLAMAVCMTLGSCGDNDDFPVNGPEPADARPAVVRNLPGSEAWESPVDYSNPYYWAAMPTTADKAYDVFYLQPTSWTPAENETSRVASMDNAEMRTVGYVWSTITGQGVFSEQCNVYAPYYRQADAGYIAGLSWDDAQTLWAYQASKDASQALDYYFEHCNNGRPFFLAGHSQGAAVVEALLADYFRLHPEYYDRMVAAYPIGYAITTDYLARNPHLKFAERADDTGVVVSWNTEGAENKTQTNIVVAPSGSLSINPINWRSDATPADVDENRGSLVVTDYEAFYAEIMEKGADEALAAHRTAGLADAAVDTERGVVVTHADPVYRHEATSVFGTASYHSFDWQFYFANVKENVAVRITAYENGNGNLNVNGNLNGNGNG